MKRRVTAVLILLLLASAPAPAQRGRKPSRAAAKPEDTGPVSVSRSATLRITIAGDAVGVFEYLSDSKKLADWFPDQAVIEPQLGGKYHFKFKDVEGTWSGVVTDFLRGNTLGLTWQAPSESSETNVRFKLSPQGAETLVELTHSGFTSNEALDAYVKSWVFFLKNLKSVIEQSTDMRGQARRATPRNPRTRRR